MKRLRFGLASLRVKALLLGVLPAMLMSLLIGGYLIGERFSALEASLLSRGQALTNELAAASLYGLFSGDRKTLEATARRFLDRPDVASIRIHDSHGQLVLQLDHPELVRQARDTPSTRLHHFRATVEGIPAPAGDDLGEGAPESAELPPPVLGTVDITLVDGSMTQLQREALVTTLLIIAGGILFTSLIALIMSQRVVDPIIALSEAVERIRRGELDARVRQRSRGEIGLLEAGFNQMARRIAMTQDELTREVEQAVKDLQTTMDALEVRNIELDLARKRALEASRAKSDFLAVISHEIRTPMNGITGFARLLARSDLNDTQRAQLRAIQESADNLLAIINEVLDFSKLESGQLEFHDERYRLRQLVESVVTLFAPQAEEKGIELRHVVYDDVPDLLLGDALRIRQVLINLVSNAVKFTERGSVIVRVMLDGDEQDEQITFSVQDTGIGIDPALGDRLFEPFTQGENDTSRRFGGTGLGLSISKRLVSGMHGSIGYDSEPGRGSTFWFTLPLRRAEAADEAAGSDSTIAPDAGQPLPRAGLRILVADDNPINLELTRALLERHAASIVTATDGESACRQAADGKFDLILMDVHMPGMNGLDAARAIRGGSGPNAETPIIAITADITPENQKRIFAAGMNEIVVKPVDEQRLGEVIAGLLERRTMEHDPPPPSPAQDTPAPPESARPDPCALPARDTDAALRVAGGREETAERMFSMLIEDLERSLPRIADLTTDDALDAAWQEVHRLSGAAAACGTPALHAALRRLGADLRARRYERLDADLSMLTEQYERLLAGDR